jgi:hypothetical protein
VIDALALEDLSARPVGDDLLLEARVNRSRSASRTG